MDAIFNFDKAILLWIQSLRTPLLNKFMVFYTQLGDHGLLFITMALLLIAIPATRRTGCASAFGLAIGALVTNLLLKPFFMRPRPYVTVPGLTNLIDMSRDPNSFPSGHATAAFGVCMAIFLTVEDKRAKAASLFVAVLMGFSRLYVAVHYPTDVIAGALIGAMINIILIFVRGRVISSKELLLSYDIKTLADLRSIEITGIGSGIDRRIENIGMGGDGKLSDGERIQKAAQLVELYAHNAENIVLIGDVSEDTLKTTAERLQQNLKGINLKYCVTLLGNNTLLRESDGVILVEKRNESRLGMIESDIGVIGEMKIPVIGVILL